jgi:SET domain-containing protein
MDELYNNTTWSLEVRESGIHEAGRGLFTLEDIPKDVFIGYYEGTITRDPKKLSLYSFEISPKYVIDALAYPRCYLAMVNDARNSKFKYNCEFRMESHKSVKKRKIALYSTKKILKGSELFANYGDDYWNTVSKA